MTSQWRKSVVVFIGVDRSFLALELLRWLFAVIFPESSAASYQPLTWTTVRHEVTEHAAEVGRLRVRGQTVRPVGTLHAERLVPLRRPGPRRAPDHLHGDEQQRRTLPGQQQQQQQQQGPCDGKVYWRLLWRNTFLQRHRGRFQNEAGRKWSAGPKGSSPHRLSSAHWCCGAGGNGVSVEGQQGTP